MSNNMSVIDVQLRNNVNLGFTVCYNDGDYPRINSVNLSGVAFNSGIREGDYIQMINGNEITRRADLSSFIKLSKGALNIKLLRDPKLVKHMSTVSVPDQKGLISSQFASMSNGNFSQFDAHRKASLDLGETRPYKRSILKEPESNTVQKTQSVRPTFQDLKEDSGEARTPLKSHSGRPTNSPFPFICKSYQLNPDAPDFDENAPVMEYTIDWAAIYTKLSPKINTKIEIELVNYFRNKNVDLTLFPVNCLHRFITFDSVLEVLFQEILQTDFKGDLKEELLKKGSQMNDLDYRLTKCNIVKLIQSNIKKTKEIIGSYEEQKRDLDDHEEQLKESLNDYLNTPNCWDSEKVRNKVDSVCTNLLQLIEFLIKMATSMSIWKLSIDLPHLYPTGHDTKPPSKMWEDTFKDFKSSEKKIMENIVGLLKQFRENCCKNVLIIFDHLFSENMELAICLSILRAKCDWDMKMENVLKTMEPEAEPNGFANPEQFV